MLLQKIVLDSFFPPCAKVSTAEANTFSDNFSVGDDLPPYRKSPLANGRLWSIVSIGSAHMLSRVCESCQRLVWPYHNASVNLKKITS